LQTPDIGSRYSTRETRCASALTVFDPSERVRILTTHMVLTEVLNAIGKRGKMLRAAVTSAVMALSDNSQVVVIPQTPEQFFAALAEYAVVVDQDWSLTDVASFQVMRRLRIREALAHDRHFEQAGFVALLRE
jgi:predicted nucleic acid-binding protein